MSLHKIDVDHGRHKAHFCSRDCVMLEVNATHLQKDKGVIHLKESDLIAMLKLIGHAVITLGNPNPEDNQ